MLQKTPNTKIILFNSIFIGLITIVILSIAFNSYSNATEIHVPNNCSTIQEAIDAASNGDMITVEIGTYYENINFKGKTITVRSQNGPTSTIIDGNAKGSVVTFDHGETAETILDGFTIRNGFSSLYGGGIHCGESSPKIINCIITANRSNCGGIYCLSSSAYIIDCTIEYNDNSEADGGGICAQSSSDSSLTISNCLIRHNNAFIGGGIFSLAPLIITDSLIYGNAANLGGGICSIFSDNSLTISNSTISGNVADVSGGGIWCTSSLILTNCTVTKNFVTYEDGGGIDCSSQMLGTISNCTISGNNAGGGGGGISCSDESSITMVNTIVWGNKAKDNEDEINLAQGSSITVSYSDIKQDTGVYPGVGNINQEPFFVDSEQGNYYLRGDSPCINRGTSTEAPSEDQVGIVRPQGTGVDMGAYEYVAPGSNIPRASFSANQTLGTDVLSVEFDASTSGASQYIGVNFHWDFGDGATATGIAVTHSYSHFGSYTVTLTVNTDYGVHNIKLGA